MEHIDKKSMKNNKNLVAIIVYLINAYLIVSLLSSIYNKQNVFFDARYSTWVMGFLLIVSVFTLFHKVLCANKLPSIIWIATWFTFWTVISTLINHNIQTDFILIPLIRQSYWWGTLILGYLAFHKKKSTEFVKLTTGVLFIAVFTLYIQYALNKGMGILPTSNMVSSYYYCLLFLPFVLTIKNPLIKNIFLGCIIFGAFLSLKRTAFIALIFSMIGYYGVATFSTSRGFKRKLYIVSSLFLILLISINLYDFVTETYNLDIFVRLNSMVEDGGSGRNRIYEYFWNEIIRFDFASWIVGKGYNGTLLNSSIRLSAHNDFIEVLYNYGIIGLILYLLFVVKLIKYNYILIRRKDENAGAYTASIILFIIVSMTSHLLIYPTYFMLLILFWMRQIGELESTKCNRNKIMNS